MILVLLSDVLEFKSDTPIFFPDFLELNPDAIVFFSDFLKFKPYALKFTFVLFSDVNEIVLYDTQALNDLLDASIHNKPSSTRQ